MLSDDHGLSKFLDITTDGSVTSASPTMASSVWRPSEGPINQPKLCNRCGKMKLANHPSYISFHICTSDWRNDSNDVIAGEVIESTEL